MFIKGSTVANEMIKNLISLHNLVVLKTLKQTIVQLIVHQTNFDTG